MKKKPDQTATPPPLEAGPYQDPPPSRLSQAGEEPHHQLPQGFPQGFLQAVFGV